MTIPTGEHASLFEAAVRGDGRAWTQLVNLHAPLVWSVARGCGLSRDDAEDVAQVVFAALVRRLPHMQDPAKISGWLVVSAKRESWRVSAMNRRNSAKNPDDIQDSSAPFQEPDLERLERQEAVRDSLRRLDKRCQTLLIELFGSSDSPSYKVVAERLGLSANSLGPTRQRCLQQLMEDLQRTSGETFSD